MRAVSMGRSCSWFLLPVLVFAAGCHRSTDSSAGTGGAPARTAAKFSTPFQDEPQFLVETIVSNLAEHVFYARNSRLPEPKEFSVVATEKPGAPAAAPAYNLEINLGAKLQKIHVELNVDGPIWSPEVYQPVAAALAEKVGLDVQNSGDTVEDTALLSALTDGAATTIEKQNQELSQTLSGNYNSTVLHQEAAELLGAFALRHHSVHFYNVELPLCQMTAHLAFAQLFAAGHSPGVNGQLAEAMLYTLMNNQATALARLDRIKSDDRAVNAWTRSLRARLTGDYRIVARYTNATPIERVAWFGAYSESASPERAWLVMRTHAGESTEFERIAQATGYSVGTGNDLLRVALPLEMQELQEVYELSNGKKLTEGGVVTALNQLPGPGFSGEKGRTAEVRIIGWGQWAALLQQQLCDAISCDFDCLERKLGVPDNALEFRKKADAQFGGLRLYPFVRILDCLSTAEYHSAMDAAGKEALAEPHLVPGYSLINLWLKVPYSDGYQPVPYATLESWCKHDPPPGTAYDMYARLHHGLLTLGPGAPQIVAGFHELAPYDRQVNSRMMKLAYQNRPATEQAAAYFAPILDFDEGAMRIMAGTVQDQPEQYTEWVSKAAALDPGLWFTLGDYHLDRGDEDKAAEFFEKGRLAEVDPLISASYASWCVKYYLKHNAKEKARAVADAAAEVYSASGLEAKAWFLEATGDYAGAFDWYAKIEQRYGDSIYLIEFCNRYKNKTHDTRFDAALKSRMAKFFPKGIEKASFQDFRSPPVDGAVFGAENEAMQRVGLNRGDVVVAVNGIRVRNMVQYAYGRGITGTNDMTLVVWQNGRYSEIAANPPEHRFGVDMEDYHGR